MGENTPIVTMIAGPNGSGKTTLTRELQRMGLEFGAYINADDHAATLSGAYDLRVRAAQVWAERERRTCLEQRCSFTFETVMSHPSKVEILRQARDAGFAVVVYFVATENADLNVARVAQRVAQGGHPVPEDRIRARYVRTLALLPAALGEADRAVLFDNSYRTSFRKPVILRPFLELRRDGERAHLKLAPPIPKWAAPALAALNG